MNREEQDTPEQLNTYTYMKYFSVIKEKAMLLFATTCMNFDCKESACNAGDPVSSLGCKDPLKKGMATHSSILGETSPVTQQVKNLPAMQDTQRWEDPLEEEMATLSSILAWRVSWTEEPGGLQSMKSHRVRHN